MAAIASTRGARCVEGALTILALVASSLAFAGGRAEVRFIEPESFTDAGFGSLERGRHQQILSDHLDRLARGLPDGQVLRIDVLDIDLAGDVRPFWHERVRVTGLGADAPRLELRFTLLDGSHVVSTGEDRLLDLGYRDRLRYRRDDGALPYERRMLDHWFRDRLGQPLAALR